MINRLIVIMRFDLYLIVMIITTINKGREESIVSYVLVLDIRRELSNIKREYRWIFFERKERDLKSSIWNVISLLRLSERKISLFNIQLKHVHVWK